MIRAPEEDDVYVNPDHVRLISVFNDETCRLMLGEEDDNFVDVFGKPKTVRALLQGEEPDE